MLTAYGLEPVAPVWGRSEEETALRVLPVACPRRDLWRDPILMVRIAGAGFWDWFSSLDGAYLYIYFHS
jgi:hypothetical protein